MFVLSKHKLAVLVTSPAEVMGSIMKENINTGETTSTESKRQGREIEKRERWLGLEADAGIRREERELAALSPACLPRT